MTADIRFIDIPEDIRDKYQYFTEADMHKLIDAGYQKNFTAGRRRGGLCEKLFSGKQILLIMINKK
jgi:hypothetical protein